MSSAIQMKGENFSPIRILHPFNSEQEAAREFSAVIIDFSTGELAQATGRSKDTAKCWKAGRAFPNGVSLMALVAEFPKIRAWHDRRVGGVSHPQSQSEMFAYLERIMASDTPDGRAMRARFQQLMAERGSA